jgi:sugar phosphate isomerase/epimerase
MSTNDVQLEIAVNGAFITRRWEEPENWMRLTRECGYPAHSFCGDVIDPFFSGDHSFRMEQAAAVKEYAAKYDVTICDYYTGVATHRFHGLSHSDARARERMMQWVEQASELCVAMGCDSLGGHVDAFSCEVLADPIRTKEAITRLYATMRELARRVKPIGLRIFSQEQMYIPSEKPWTLAECEEFLVESNKGNEDIPIYVTVDVGHMAGMHYGLSGQDIDYVEWLKRFGSVSEIVHLQQTTPEASHHWGFTAEANKKGHVQMEKVLEALQYAHAHHDEQPFAKYLAPVKRHWMVSEIIPGSTRHETALLEELTENAKFLRQYIPEGGTTL